jgi:UDP-N-acetylglucosamine acyltransferase
VIGDRNTVREFCTFNTGTVQDGGVTRIGNDNWIMAYVHIAHDCVVGNHTTLANNATLAGHVHVGDWVILGGLTGVHQFMRIGAMPWWAFQPYRRMCRPS